MKHRVVTTKQGKLVVSSIVDTTDIHQGDKYLSHDSSVICEKYASVPIEGSRRIITTINFSLDKDIPMVIVEDEVEKLAEHSSEVQEGTYTPQHKVTYKHGFIDGYKAAQQKGVYSEEIIISNFEEKYNEFINSGGLNGSSSDWIDHSKLIPWFKNYIQSLNQEYIELEMVENYDNDVSIYPNVLQIKTNRVDGQLMAYIKK